MDREIWENGVIASAAELREHLGIITAASQVLERATESEKERGYLAAIDQSICRMLRLIGRLELTHRLTDEDEIRTRNATLDLTPQLEELEKRLSAVLSAIQVKFCLECSGALILYGDAVLLRQMLLEMIAAAAEGATQVTLRVYAAGGEMNFLVCADGPAARLEQLLGETDELSGIALAQQIAALHGGVLAAETPAQGGVRLGVSLPIREGRSNGRLESPALWRSGGFDPALVALSNLLPPEAFLPKDQAQGK